MYEVERMMFNIRVRLALQCLNRIEKYDARIKDMQGFITRMRGWIRRDKKQLNQYLKKMTDEEYDMFCTKSGHPECMCEQKKYK